MIVRKIVRFGCKPNGAFVINVWEVKGFWEILKSYFREIPPNIEMTIISRYAYFEKEK